MTLLHYATDTPGNIGDLGSEQKDRIRTGQRAKRKIDVAAGRGLEIDREEIPDARGRGDDQVGRIDRKDRWDRRQNTRGVGEFKIASRKDTLTRQGKVTLRLMTEPAWLGEPRATLASSPAAIRRKDLRIQNSLSCEFMVWPKHCFLGHLAKSSAILARMLNIQASTTRCSRWSAGKIDNSERERDDRNHQSLTLSGAIYIKILLWSARHERFWSSHATESCGTDLWLTSSFS
jgi:hypothetical protein